MRIGAAAEQAGVNVQTLRYYERRGLLPRPPRRTSGYREFPDEAVRVVRFVKRAQDLGFTLDESESKLGLITASRKLTSRRPLNSREVMGGLAWTALLPYLGGPMLAYNATTGVKEPQLVRVTLVTSAAGGTTSATSVRVTAQRVVYADESQVKIKSVESLNDPAFYQEFFSRLSNSVFLEGQK
jgi:hypothetical protein